MKKLLFLLLIVILFSCEKQGDCWICTISENRSGVISEDSSEQVCDMNALEISQYEKQVHYSGPGLSIYRFCEKK